MDCIQQPNVEIKKRTNTQKKEDKLISIFPLRPRLLLFEVKPPTWGYQWIFPCKWKLKGPHRCSGRPPEGCKCACIFRFSFWRKVVDYLKREHLARCWNSRRCSLAQRPPNLKGSRVKKFVCEHWRVRRPSDVPTRSHLSTCFLRSARDDSSDPNNLTKMKRP
jgi:hypothetical protein